MKIIALLLLITVHSQAFQMQRGKASVLSSPKITSLKMGFFDFKPIHGSGSAGPKELEDQYRLQQELLKARRDHINYDSLHKKYSTADPNHTSDVFSLGKKITPDKYAESYVDPISKKKMVAQSQKEETKKEFKFPWDFLMRP